MSGIEDDDSDTPEELTVQQGLEQHNEIVEAQSQSKARVRREVKERRKKWAERLTPRQRNKADASEGDGEMVDDEVDVDSSMQSQVNRGMLPDDIVKMLAAREKQVFLSDSEEEKAENKPKTKKKKAKISSGVETVILKELPPPPCVQNSLDFLKERKMRTTRSSAVLKNASQVLRQLSSSGLLQ